MNSDQTMSIVAYDKSELEKINFSKPKPVQYNFKKIATNKTITNPSFALSLNEKETNESLLTDEVKFALSNGSLNYDIKTVLNSCPALTKYISQIKTPKTQITINLPQWIRKSALEEYFSYFKGCILMDSSVKSFYSILRLADCFENYTLLGDIIKSKIIPTLSYDSAILFLQEAFQKIDHNNLSFNWYELFTATKEFISIHIAQFIRNNSQKLISIQKSLLEEIIEYHLLLTNNLEKDLLQFLIAFRQCNDIYELISSEYLLASSEENYANMLNSTYSFLHCDIKDSGSFYQEIPKKYNKTLDVVFYLSYKESEDLFKINFKISNEQQPKLYSFAFICFFGEGQRDKKHCSVKVISNLKGCSNIIQINKFRGKRNKTLSIHMKINPIHTHTLQYLANNFTQEYYHMPGIVKMSSSMLKSVLQISQAQKASDSTLVKAVSLWLNDEINMNDDLNKELIKMIDWSKVQRVEMVTFLVKYTWLIDKEMLSSYFFEELKIDKELLIGIKEAKFDKLLIENINLKKSIEANKDKQDSLESNKIEFSAIKKPCNSHQDNNMNSNKLFNNIEEGEGKLHLQSNTIDTKESLMSLKSKDNRKPIHEDNHNKQQLKSYEAIRTIEFEISAPTLIENEVVFLASPPVLLSETKLDQRKRNQKKGRLFKNVVNKIELCSLNQNNIQKVKEASRTDRSSSISESNVNNKHNKAGGKTSIDLITKGNYSPFVRRTHKQIITTSNTKPQFCKRLYTLND